VLRTSVPCLRFLADRTKYGRAYATVFVRLSSSVLIVTSLNDTCVPELKLGLLMTAYRIREIGWYQNE